MYSLPHSWGIPLEIFNMLEMHMHYLQHSEPVWPSWWCQRPWLTQPVACPLRWLPSDHHLVLWSVWPPEKGSRPQGQSVTRGWGCSHSQRSRGALLGWRWVGWPHWWSSECQQQPRPGLRCHSGCSGLRQAAAHLGMVGSVERRITLIQHLQNTSKVWINIFFLVLHIIRCNDYY